MAERTAIERAEEVCIRLWISTSMAPAIAAAIESAERAAAEKEREEIARLMEGPGRGLDEFNAAQTFCRWVEHAQDQCECAERAAAIRARGRKP